MIKSPNTNRNEERNSISFFFLLVFTFVLVGRPQDYFLFLVPLRPAMVCAALTLVSVILEKPKFPDNYFKIREIRLVIAFYLVLIAGIPFAVHKRVAFDFVFFDYPKTLIYFFILIGLVQSAKRVNAVALVTFGSAFFTSLFYVKGAMLAARLGSRFYASAMYDPNDIAMVLVTYLPLSIYFILTGGILKRVISIVAAILMVIGILMSQSRGGILALGVIMCGMFFFKTSRWKGGAKVVVIGILSVVFIYYFGIVQERFSNIQNDYNVTDESGRMTIWKQNLEILAGRPLLGVGGGCSTIALGFYRAEHDGTQMWQVTHSSLIQLAVEAGLIGFTVILTANVGALLAMRRIRKEKDHALSLLCFFVEMSFYGFWLGALFLSHGYSIHLYLLLGIMGAVRNLDNKLKAAYESESEGAEKSRKGLVF